MSGTGAEAIGQEKADAWFMAFGKVVGSYLYALATRTLEARLKPSPAEAWRWRLPEAPRTPPLRFPLVFAGILVAALWAWTGLRLPRPKGEREHGRSKEGLSTVMRKAISLGLVVVGAVLIGFGWNEADSMASELTELFRGRPTEDAIGLLVAGAACATVGLVGLFARFGRRA